MTRAANNAIGVIADDFTGALDTGVEFVRAGFETIVLIRPAYHAPAAVYVINTDSRDTDAATAQRRVAEAARQLLGRRMFKKIDSTMRGHIGAEIEAVLDATGLPKGVVCPAVIEAGRTVQHGQLWINNVPLHATDFAGDPFWPARTSDITRLVGRPATHVAIETVRAGAGALARAIASATTRIVTVDACSQADLAVIGQALTADMLPCGALGLARAWAGSFEHAPPAALAPVMQRNRRAVLIVAGSRHPNTIAQVNNLVLERPVTPVEVGVSGAEQRTREWLDSMIAALSAGRSVVLRAPAVEIAQADDQRRLVELLGTLTAQVCRAVALGGLVLTGGETASAICRRLDTAGVRILGELEVGVPWGQIIDGAGAGLPLVTKAGGFGSAAALIKATDVLRPQ